MHSPIMSVPRRLARSLATSAAVVPKLTGIAGTVPLHERYVLLHSRTPITVFPAKPSSALQRTLQLSNPGTLFNFAWYQPERGGQPPWGQEAGTTEKEESYPATLFDGQHAVETRAQSGVEWAHAGTSGSPDTSDHLTLEETPVGTSPVHLLVCTHGSRDCRCGETGGAVVRALRDAHAERLARATDAAERERWELVKIGEVAHVGGHVHAANVLIYPRGNWFVLYLSLYCVPELTTFGVGWVSSRQKTRLHCSTPSSRASHSFKALMALCGGGGVA
jgi:hypothetical protein